MANWGQGKQTTFRFIDLKIMMYVWAYFVAHRHWCVNAFVCFPFSIVQSFPVPSNMLQGCNICLIGPFGSYGT